MALLPNSSWMEATLGGIVGIFDYRRIPLSGTQRKERQGEYPYYGASGIIDYIDDYIFDGRYLLIAEDGENLNSRKLPVAFFASGKFWVNNHAHIVRGMPGIADDYFLYGWFVQANISGYITGAAQPKLTQENLKRISLHLPPLPTQRKIAAILSAYGDLIENNLRRIKILEEMAQNLYHEWFVKFRFPGHQQARFTDSPLGSIPVGWEVRELREFVDFERGVEPGSKNYASQLSENYVPFLRVGDLGKRESDLFVNKSFARGRILMPDDIAITMDGTVGLVRMGLEGAYSSGIRRVARKSDCPIGNAFIFQLLNSERIQAIIEAHAKGTTIKHASSSIGHMTFVLPDRIVAEAFEEYAEPINSLTLSLGTRSEALRRIRDLLLPRLISGEVDVSALDIAVPEGAEA